MNWSVSYETFQKIKDKDFSNQVNEIRIEFSAYYDLKTIKEVLQSLKDNNKRIVIIYNEAIEKNFGFFIELYKEWGENSFYIRKDKLEQNTEDIPFFLSVFCYTKEKFMDLYQTYATDIYVSDVLGFNVAYLTDAEVNVRAIPCVAQNTGLTPKFSDFYVRPEDIRLYEGCIDTFEIPDLPNASILAEIYISKGKWIGDLSDIIYLLPKDLIGDRIIPDFGQRRMNCKKKCFEENSRCRICWQYADLCAEAKRAGIYFNVASG